MKVMLLLVGAPASGKSTWIKENNLSDYVVSYDYYREKFPLVEVEADGVVRKVIDNSYQNNKRAIAFAQSDILKRASKGELIIVDNQNLRRKARRDLMKLIKGYGYKVFAVDIQEDTSLETLLERNADRPEHKYVPISVIEKAHKLYCDNIKAMKADDEILYLSSEGGAKLADVAKDNRAILDPFLENIDADMVINMKLREALLSSKPSQALAEIEEYIKDYIPELYKLKYVNQDPKWHPEGNVWNHTMQVLDAAAHIKEDINEEYRLEFMYASLLHDFGKYTASYVKPDGKISARYHDIIGEVYSEELLKRIAVPGLNSSYVTNLVGQHMKGHNIMELRDITIERWIQKEGLEFVEMICYLNAADNNRGNKFVKEILYIKSGLKAKLKRVKDMSIS